MHTPSFGMYSCSEHSSSQRQSRGALTLEGKEVEHTSLVKICSGSKYDSSDTHIWLWVAVQCKGLHESSVQAYRKFFCVSEALQI